MPSGHRADRIRRAATNAADPELKAVAREISLRYLRFLLFKDESHTMHPLFTKADRLSGEVIGDATLVHRIMGPGLESSNFHEVKLVDGISTLMLIGAKEP